MRHLAAGDERQSGQVEVKSEREDATMPGSCLRSERFIVCVDVAGDRHKIFQCQFSRDGSVFVSFPYYRHSSGLVSHVGWPAGQPTTVVSLEVGGKVSSHLVKYVHHPDGEAHFSQDGKVKTIIRKKSVPLADYEGHVFSLHVRGLHDFDVPTQADLNKPPGPRRTSLTFTVDQPQKALKFVGRVHSSASLQRRANDGVVHPTMDLVGPDGTTKKGFICSAPMGSPAQEMCVLLTCEPFEVDEARESSLLFVAGFNHGAEMNDPSVPVSFLALSYPAENFEDLQQRLGSIDYRP
jgi:hypothetical protein